MIINNFVTPKDTQPAPLPSETDFVSNDINIKNELSRKHLELLEEVRNHLKNYSSEPLDMVDALQKLCINHYYEEEIGLILKSLYARMSNNDDYKHDKSLYEVSLSFRILRQEGYYVSADVFADFKQKDGKFKEEIAQDVKGLMALYEASQLSLDGEQILQEASDFSSGALKEMVPSLDQDQAMITTNILQHTWWKDLGLAQELKLARNQPLHWYLWPMASLTDLSLSEQRIELTKPIAFIFLIDDIFDVYGTLDQLVILTQAVNRWESNSLEQLPHHLRICIQALFDVTNEISDNIYKKHGFNPIDFLKQSWINLCEAFLVEAKWFAEGYMPTAEDYLNNGMVSTGAHVVIMHMFFLLGGGPNIKSASIVNENQGITCCLAKILRLWDDLGSAEDVDQDGNDGSYVAYYMKENADCSIQKAHEHVMEMISNTWKQLNAECLYSSHFSRTFTKACLNLARMIPMMYDYDENHSLPFIKEYINSMF
ncbi:(3S,6E)-nerolidol synthase 1-like protein [Tanacetum coccineum]|uniref:(3S,6E)-nerolidol synthase 1-like protein n=1 Tax=Tanacetum coccineum TaxID=301880 RepID=A0ABQ5GM62_9ASTR